MSFPKRHEVHADDQRHPWADEQCVPGDAEHGRPDPDRQHLSDDDEPVAPRP